MVHINPKHPGLILDGASIPSLDAVIPRIGPSMTVYGLALVRQFEMMNAFAVNNSAAIARARDKLTCLQVLSSHGILVPRTIFTTQPDHARQAIEMVGGVPVVLKLMNSTQGLGVMLADTLQMARSVLDTLYNLGQSILIQQYVPEARGQDIRAFVVGDKVVAAIRRIAAAGEFRSNLHRGGRSEPAILDETSTGMAVRAARVMGLNVAGVDMLESNAGPMVLEVNASPGLEGIETSTKVDVAAAIIEFTEGRVCMPENLEPVEA
jgi:ribosomal protein S6--L-glutamate ligase